MGLIFTEHAVLRYSLRCHLPIDEARCQAHDGYRSGRQLTRQEAEQESQKRLWVGGEDITWRADGIERGVWLTIRRPTGSYVVIDFQAPGEDADHITVLLELLKATNVEGGMSI